MGKPQALEKEEKVEEAQPRLCKKNSQGAHKETRPGYLEAARTREGDPREMQERINQDWTALVSILWVQGTRKDMSHQLLATQKKRIWKQMMTQELEPEPDEGKPGTLGRVAR